MHVVIGVESANSLSEHKLSADTRAGVLKPVLDQLSGEVTSGFTGLVLNVYPLSGRSITSQPLRLTLPCLEPEPTTPDLRQIPTWKRAEALQSYEKAKAQSKAALDHAQQQMAQFSQQVLAMQTPATPTDTDIWGFLTVASDEFQTVDSSDRHVVIIAGDENVHTTYCDGCVDLRGANVHFAALDLSTPAEEQRRRSNWTDWLSKVHAGNVTFNRSNESLPSLFAHK
jgi:hypothetical protein